jgi:tellurite methyltransferase
MHIKGWNERYRSREQKCDFDLKPTPLLIEASQSLEPGRALDLASGTGRNAFWLAARGWLTTAVDGSAAAIASLREQADRLGVTVEAHVADLRGSEFAIDTKEWDLVLMSYYLQRELFAPVKRSVLPGGRVIAIVHTTYPGEEPTETRLRPGELITYFEDWSVLHSYEGASRDPAHRRPVAEIVAQRPGRRELSGTV